MFNIFRNKKKYASCTWLEYGITFSPIGIEHCCMYNPKYDKREQIVPLKDFQYDIDSYIEIKKQIIKDHVNGHITNRCIGCYELKTQNWGRKNYFQNAVFNLNYKCNSNCSYCFTHKHKEYYNSMKDIPIYEIIKDLIKKKLLRSNSEIHLGGGEPTLNQEFESIMDIFLSNNFNNIQIYSSGIKYSPAIEKAIYKKACDLYISTDSGDEELYKKIKNTDKYYEVWQNIQKYCSVQQDDDIAVWIKYIIIPNINDNKEAIKTFIDKVFLSGGKGIAIDLERNWYSFNKKNDEIMKNIIKLIKYMEICSNEKGIKYVFFPSCVYIADKYREYYDSLKAENL